METARWFSGLLFGVNIFVAGRLVFAETKSILISIWTSVLTMSTLPIVQVHSMAWSEPLFILFESCALLFLMSYFRTLNHGYLIAAAGAAGMSAITRYAGAALIASGLASILTLSHGNKKHRFLHAGAFLTSWFISTASTGAGTYLHRRSWKGPWSCACWCGT